MEFQPGDTARLQPSPEAAAALRTIGAFLESPLPNVSPGQLWRGSWRSEALLLLVLEVKSTHVAASPVTTDVEMADGYTLLVPAAESPLDVSLAIFAGLTLDVRPIALDAYFGQLDAVALGVARDLYRANALGMPPSSQDRYRCGEQDLDDLDERRDYRIEISQSAARIAMAELDLISGHQESLPAILRDHRVGPSSLAVALKLDLQDARQLATGARPPTAIELEAVSDLTGLDTDLLRRAARPVPAGLIEAVASPHIFRFIREEAENTGTSFEDVVRSVPMRFSGRRQATRDPLSDRRYWEEAIVSLLGRDRGR